LPINFSRQVSSMIAESLDKIFKEKTAIEWEKELGLKGIAGVRVQSFQEWMDDAEAKKSRISDSVSGLPEAERQIGRMVWLKNKEGAAINYPDLKKMTEVDMASIDLNKKPYQSASKAGFHEKPLEGFSVVDFSNVLAGPNCGRMLSELGATVFKVEPQNPQHPPMVMVTWQAEGNAGKKTIIVDFKTKEGKQVANDLIKKCDFVLFNKNDDQIKSLGLDRENLDQINKKAIHLNLQARRGENIGSEAAQWPGYDPALQGKTGLSYRFGPKGCPTLHGVASCVDYCTAYMGAWAGVTALYARETHGSQGLSSGTSLALVASLMQLTHLGDVAGQKTPPEGPKARGPNPHTRTYQLKRCPESWIYVVADKDLTQLFEDKFASVDEALAGLKAMGYQAVEVLSCRKMADRSQTSGSETARCEKRERKGLETATWKPTWICYDGKPMEHPGAVGPTGCDREEILTNFLGYDKNKANQLLEMGAVRQDYWIDCKN